jgi:hypothetical protein
MPVDLSVNGPRLVFLKNMCIASWGIRRKECFGEA